MPGQLLPYLVKIYHHARDLPESVWDVFRRYPVESSIMYASALANVTHSSVPTSELYITCIGTESGTIEFILSCNDGPVGSLPIFIFTSLPPSGQVKDRVLPAITQLAESLLNTVPTTRVFSVFAPTLVTEAFTHVWTQVTQIEHCLSHPYYNAMLSFCTRQMMTKDRCMTMKNVEIILATEAHVSDVAELCFGFAQDSEPFVLTQHGAIAEATYLIDHCYVWLLRVNDQPASIVSSSRRTPEVAAITKVFTAPRYRGEGLAEHLVRHVMKCLFSKHQTVALYVARSNAAANTVYRRIGFAGLDQMLGPTQGVSEWLEASPRRALAEWRVFLRRATGILFRDSWTVGKH